MKRRVGQSDDEDGSTIIETADGLSCGGKDYVQFIIRYFSVVVTELSIRRSVTNWINYQDEASFRSNPDEATVDFAQSTSQLSLVGRGRIDTDSLGVIGTPDLSTTELEVYFYRVEEPRPKDRDFRWRGHIIMLPYDWEIGSDDSWSVTVYLPAAEFDVLFDYVDRGKFGGGEMSLETDLWAESHAKHAPPSARVSWFLKPGKHSSPDSGRAIVSRFGWKALPDSSRETSEASARMLPSDEAKQENKRREDVKLDSTIDKYALLSIQKSLKVISSALVVIVFLTALSALR